MVAAADVQALALAGLYVAGVTLAFAGNRTMLHVATGNAAWLALLFRDPWVPTLGAAALAVLAALAAWRPPRLFLEVLGGERDLGPAMFFAGFAAVGALWTWLGFPPWLVLVALLPMAFADPLGFYAGRAWGRGRLPNGKSLEGFLAVAAGAFVVLAALTFALEPGLAFGPDGLGAALRFALVAAVAGAAAETLAPRHLDNLLMPLATLGGGLLAFALWGAR